MILHSSHSLDQVNKSIGFCCTFFLVLLKKETLPFNYTQGNSCLFQSDSLISVLNQPTDTRGRHSFLKMNRQLESKNIGRGL